MHIALNLTEYNVYKMFAKNVILMINLSLSGERGRQTDENRPTSSAKASRKATGAEEPIRAERMAAEKPLGAEMAVQ
jgi:hypothetical protein